MKKLNPDLEKYRVKTGPTGTDASYGNNGAFFVYNPFGKNKSLPMKVLASDGAGWDHVSVSLPDRCPAWDEMNHVKDLFFEPEEIVAQFHPARSEYINNCGFCLHLWRPQAEPLPTPPQWMVGYRTLNPPSLP